MPLAARTNLDGFEILGLLVQAEWARSIVPAIRP
jgi:hypothetical protein